MKKIKFLIIVLFFILPVLFFFFLYNFLPSKKVALGVWTEGFYNSTTRSLHPEKLLEFEKLTKKKYSLAHYYRGWEALAEENLIDEFKTLRQNGWEPVINTNPYFFSKCPPVEEPLYRAIAGGKCDEFLYEAAENLSHVEEPFYLLFAWEMNNKDLEWSIPYSGSTSEEFKNAWRHIHDIFKNRKAKNIIWVFCPNIPDVPEFSYKDIYPGDKYVDWMCLDGYNWGTTQSWSEWYSFSGVYKSSYDTLVGIAPDKPIMIGEVNTTDKGGNKAEWYINMFTNEIPRNFPNVKKILIFNEDRSHNENVNWKVDINNESLNAFIMSVNSNYYE